MNLRRENKKIGGFLLLYSMITLVSYGFNLGIAPTNFQLNLRRAETKEVTVLNNTDREMRVEIFPEKPEDISDKEYLGEYIKVYPKILTIRPHGRKVVKFAVRTPQNLPDGNYKSYLVFREVPSKPSEEDRDINESGISIQMITEIAISIYGTKGERN